MPGVSFDRAAGYYDATRGYPAGVDGQLRDAIVAHVAATYATHFLELGVGTGRIALPFLQAGYDYTGIDISTEMMAELSRKVTAQGLPNPQLHVGDVANMPFADASYDVIVSVHVLHLVDDWNATLREAGRVVRPGGYIILANDDHIAAEPPNPPDQIFPVWDAILDELSVPPEQRRAGAVRGLDSQFEEQLRDAGATVERITLITYPGKSRSAREGVQRFQQRLFSSCWAIPDDTFAIASKRLGEWLATTCTDPDTQYANMSRIDAIVARM
jgi:ubiquinone/menaquinone biosynthesis C-methylase UbiE